MPGPLQVFFDGFQPQFLYDPLESATSEFQRLLQVKGWHSNDHRYRAANRKFKNALIAQFNFNYGMDENSLTGWQALCEALGKPVPTTVAQGKKIVKGTHVNLVDLTEGRKHGRKIKTFKTIAKLKKYTWETKKIFPKDDAKAGGLLKYLLRPILT
ncbi:hypothetical protein H1R20_g12029, partial [Candolleomyces eurysporus]